MYIGGGRRCVLGGTTCGGPHGAPALYGCDDRAHVYRVRWLSLEGVTEPEFRISRSVRGLPLRRQWPIACLTGSPPLRRSTSRRPPCDRIWGAPFPVWWSASLLPGLPDVP